MDNEFKHHGVKGMKWGVRRYQNKDGSLTKKGIKKYAKAGYAKDSYKSNETASGKIYDKITGAHKIAANMRYENSSKNKNEARAKKYLEDEKKSNSSVKRKASRVAVKGAAATAKTLGKIGKVYLTDQLFFGGAGTKMAKTAVVTTGRAAVTAYVMARGGHDIRWYDKQGRRVG